jgi:hypothetical protein
VKLLKYGLLYLAGPVDSINVAVGFDVLTSVGMKTTLFFSCNALRSYRNPLTFQKNVLSPSSASRCNTSEKVV